MTPPKIKCFSVPAPNCEIITSKNNMVWEPRVYNEDNDWVYAYHKGYLWPQRESGDYYRFRLIQVIGQEWQKFRDYQENQ